MSGFGESELRESELRVFVDAVLHFFSQGTREAATIRSAFLTDTAVPQFPYTGLITCAGQFRGCVHFSAPRELLRALLVEWSEYDLSEDNLLDAVGEIANTIAGNARRHFGRGLDISVPITVSGPSTHIKAAVRARPFVIALNWRGHEAAVVVDIAPVE